MKIKKPVPSTSDTSGGGIVADRFRLDPIEPQKPVGTVGKKSATWALVFGLIALAVTAGLTILLWKHWEFLMAV